MSCDSGVDFVFSAKLLVEVLNGFGELGLFAEVLAVFAGLLALDLALEVLDVELVLDFGFVDALLEFGNLEVEFLGLLGHFLHLDLEAVFQLLDQNFVVALVGLQLRELGTFAELVLYFGLEVVVL
jgi:hypothetical protein